MQEIVTYDCCVGCGACINRCPRHCIAMEPREGGFLYPVINSSLCVDCGQCQTVCPALHHDIYSQSKSPKAYAAYQMDDTALMQCSSGGVYQLLAQDTLKRGGVVFGAAFDDSFRVIHQSADSWVQAAKFQSSKYVQSQIGNTYQEARAYLDAGRPVLFTGTPCQISGLKRYLGKDYPDLLCQDIVCHSVPSPRIWADFLSTLQKQQNSAATHISFRAKVPDWEGYHFYVSFANGQTYDVPASSTPFMRAFIHGLISRPSCYTCPFKGFSRDSDVTLADFWGVQQVCPSAYHRKGTSLVLLHTQKGIEALDRIRPHLSLEEVDPLEAVSCNPAAREPSVRSSRYSYFWTHYDAESFLPLVETCLRPTVRARIKASIRGSFVFKLFRHLSRNRL